MINSQTFGKFFLITVAFRMSTESIRSMKILSGKIIFEVCIKKYPRCIFLIQ